MGSLLVAGYFGGLLGTVVLVPALPVFIAGRLLPFPRLRQGTTLVIIVVSITTYLALVGYTLVPARHFIDATTLRGANDSFWEMHGDELMFASQYSPSDPYRQQVERQVEQERQWYFEGYLLATVVAVVLIGLLYGLHCWYGRHPRSRYGILPWHQ